MFAVRIEGRERSQYEVYECASYSVVVSDDGAKRLVLNNASGLAVRSYEIGPSSPYACAFVTNELGKTVDAIRSDARGKP